MEVIYYNKKVMGGKYDYDYDNWYVPDKKVIICISDTISKYGVINTEQFLIKDKETLKEAESITQGNFSEIEGVFYSNLKRQEYSAGLLKRIIKKLEKFNKLESKVKQDLNQLSK